MKFSLSLVIFLVIGVVGGMVIVGIISNFTGYTELARSIGIPAGVVVAFYGHRLWLKRGA